MPHRKFIFFLLAERVPVQCSEDDLDDPLSAIWGNVSVNDIFPLIHKHSSVIKEKITSVSWGDSEAKQSVWLIYNVNQQHKGRIS